jgi:phytoene desaturase
LQKSLIIIGAGFSSLAAACFMAKAGWQVTVIEKHHQAGGRARQLKEEGFVFDMGPSWYWMPDVFERFFNQFGKHVSDYYSLQRLDPSYRVYWQDDSWDIPSNLDELKQLFNQHQPNSSTFLDKFLKEAAYKYEVGINKLVHKPGQSLTEFLDIDLVKGLFKLDVFTNMQTHVAKHFSHPKIKQLLEFPVLFLGALPQNIPALYSLMNYADIVGGTWYPQNGMYSIVQGMYNLAKELGVQFQFNANAKKIITQNNKATGLVYEQNGELQTIHANAVLAGADYYFVETNLLEVEQQSYTTKYWDSRVMAPSCLLYYVGINKKLQNLPHHSLFFDTDFGVHGSEIYTTKTWPKNPLFYVSCTSVTDNTVAPEGCENLFFLIPIAAGLEGDTEEWRDNYFVQIVKRFETRIGQSISQNIIYKKSYSVSNFMQDYGAFKGNAYGLANTLLQTSILKPSFKSKKVKNLFYTGQLTVPGPGVPPSLISGEVVAKQIIKQFKN